VVKLTDFGLEGLRAEEEEEAGHQKDHAFWKRRLWTAPELVSLQYNPRYSSYWPVQSSVPTQAQHISEINFC
jgi:hypothetical protein